MASDEMVQQQQQEQQRQRQQQMVPPTPTPPPTPMAQSAVQPAPQRRLLPDTTAVCCQPPPGSLRDMLRVSGGLVQPSAAAADAAWWLDNSTLQYIVRLHRLDEPLVLTIDAEPVTLSFDQVKLMRAECKAVTCPYQATCHAAHVLSVPRLCTPAGLLLCAAASRDPFWHMCARSLQVFP